MSGDGGAATQRHPRRARPIEWAALVAGLIPVVVAVGRAAVRHWMPMGDAAYFTARSLDVFTTHWPLVGAWSSGSEALDELVNNLGPLQLDLLAPFTRLSPYLGTGVATAAVNAGCVALVWWAARRVFGPARVALVMAGTLVLLATLGLSWLLDARQQHAMVLPLYALMWLATAMAAGSGGAVLWGLAVASLVVQTHFTYVYQGVVVLAAGLTAFAVRASRDRPPGLRRLAVAGAAVLAVCWVQPLVDQFAGDGNLGKVLASADGGRPGAGVATAARLLAGGAFTPPFWVPGSVGDFLLPFDRSSGAEAAITMLAWTAAGAGLVVAGRRTRRPAAVLAGGAALAGLAAALLAATRIPPSVFGLVPQNYYWIWPVAAFVTLVLLAGAASLPVDRWLAGVRRATWATPALSRAGGAVALAALAALAAWPRYPVATVARDEAAAQRVGRPLRAQLAHSLARPTFPDTVEVDLSGGLFGNAYPFVVLTELQRAGVEFRYPPGNTNLYRFGSSRCAPAGMLPRVRLIAGDLLELPPEAIVLAEVDGFGDDDEAELRDLQAYFGDALRDGTVVVDTPRAEAATGGAVDVLDAVLTTPGRSARGLAESMREWRSWGHVELPGDAVERFDRWVDLEYRSMMDYQLVLLEQPSVERSDVEMGGDRTC